MRHLLPALLLLAQGTHAQPLVDVAQLNAYASPGALSRTEVSATLPLRLDGSGRHLVVFDPYHVQWDAWTPGAFYEPATDGDVHERMAGDGMAVTYVRPLGSASPWSMAIVGIGRYHWLEEPSRGDWQAGGAALAVRRMNEDLVLRCGAYLNHDAFGWFGVPLLGVHWRIAPGRHLYGVLPGALTYEHRLTKAWCAGASFRAYTTSFGSRDGDYRRIDENPFGVYVDRYLWSRVVLRGEVGYSSFRQVRGGVLDPCTNNPDRKGYVDHALGDGLYVRVILAFRVRLDEPR